MTANQVVHPKNHLSAFKFLKSSATAHSLETSRGVESRVGVSYFKRYILKDIGRRFATEDIRRTGPIIFLSMSSSDLPCVSGTQNIWEAKKCYCSGSRNRKYCLLAYHKDQAEHTNGSKEPESTMISD